MVRSSILILQMIMTALLVRAWMTPSNVWQWKLSVSVLELGHWLVVPALISALLGGLLVRGAVRWLPVNLGVLVAIGALIPSWQASKLDKDFRWEQLWTVDSPPAIAPLQRKTYWRSYKDALEALIYKPANPPAKPGPWILALHSAGWEGKLWSSGDTDEFSAWNRRLAAQGYVIVSMGFHDAPAHKWPAQRDDVRNAVKWVNEHAEELHIDPERMIIMGRSSGGQIATVCATTMPDLNVKGCIALYSPMDLEFAHTWATEDDVVGTLKLLRNYMGGDPDVAGDNYRTASATNYVTAKTVPTLLLHGRRDAIVWVEQSIRYKGKFEKAGIGDRCTFVELPWAVHAFDFFPNSPGGQVSLYEVTEFLKQF
jgi:acetyl esterase/lipase